ncbi:MAG: helix-turn-helix transcriptional regulator [Oscillospiraceae bacterium]|jgi:transcriptional regulator with XRE-family HTH domain|nr:helix-turn-helix transcriptional regulator [Oscillospiraceae bacterium]
MSLNDILSKKGITKYRLSKVSGVPFSTISEISTGKLSIAECKAKTVYRIAKALDVTVEELLSEAMEYRPRFETFKSNVCHMVKDMGDMEFIIQTYETDKIRKLFDKKWYLESLYLLAMVDYLSRENDLPIAIEYEDIRSARLREPVYPASVLVKSIASKSEQPLIDSMNAAIPEFKRCNIVEAEVRNVC